MSQSFEIKVHCLSGENSTQSSVFDSLLSDYLLVISTLFNDLGSLMPEATRVGLASRKYHFLSSRYLHMLAFASDIEIFFPTKVASPILKDLALELLNHQAYFFFIFEFEKRYKQDPLLTLDVLMTCLNTQLKRVENDEYSSLLPRIRDKIPLSFLGMLNTISPRISTAIKISAR